MTGLSSKSIEGRLRVPSSKSLSHRWLNVALLSRRPMVIERPLVSEDIHLFLAALGRCGFQVEERGDDVHLQPVETPAGEVEIFCGNAGTMLRLLVATFTVVPGIWRLDGIPRLRERPVRPLVDALRKLGANIEYLGEEGFVPLRIEGGTLGAGTTLLDAGESSQYLSAILMAALRAPGEVTVEVSSLTSGPYVDVTLGVVEAAGGRIERLGDKLWRVHPSGLHAEHARVEGDWSAACYPAAAAALTGGKVVLEGLARDSRQGDRGFLDLLLKMGAEADWRGDELEVRGTGRLVGIEADLSTMPDQVPTLAALGPFAEGETHIFNVAHLRIKESDRLEAMATELRKLGAEVDEGPDSLRIPGIWAHAAPPDGTVLIDPRGDHRIAMSLALAGLRRPGVVVDSPEVVSKSYPGFWKDLSTLMS
ncbi:MAG TPA: 3-phosphoshikimate 1-carboxyvinyltransferase [Thermoanaerobaculia bacterium]|jgi:3-phosphoshikimate 1-carboxyvinyltransferase|nr:3-phosphoshikimate 1-carboxyvinyltransferase [Thermoanaerobaculia bacterium]